MGVGALMLAGPAPTQVCKSFLDCPQVASMRHAGAAAAGPARDPKMELACTGVIATPALQDKPIKVAWSFLPGLREAAGVGQQLSQAQQMQANLQQAI